VVSDLQPAPGPRGEDMAASFQRMVHHGLRVRVSSNILTQQAYLELNFLDPNRFPAEVVPWEPEYPLIPSATSELTTIKDSLDKILNQKQEIDVRGLSYLGCSFDGHRHHGADLARQVWRRGLCCR
jgi:hypothetical protein